ncbi:MAG: hypothetical protein JWR10_2140 [Rubritepida sp.]|nr:hypothetical protein [Rubritepida sp.]
MPEPVQNRFAPCHRLAAASGQAHEVANALAQTGNDNRAKIARNPYGAPRCLGEGALLERFPQHIILRDQP